MTNKTTDAPASAPAPRTKKPTAKNFCSFLAKMRRLRQATSTIELEDIRNALLYSDPKTLDSYPKCLEDAHAWIDAVERQIDQVEQAAV